MRVNYPERIITKSKGTTTAEEYLGKLCSDTFLSFWSYPNIYRDQGRNRKELLVKGDGKELCDLLAIYGNHIFIFSDKDCEFPNTGDLSVDWSRWYKKTILSAANQIYGAERWLRQFPDTVYLDKDCENKFPLKIPSPDKAFYHRIVVAHGASNRCSQYFGGGSSGSLMIRTTLEGELHYRHAEHIPDPFAVGRIDAKKGYVHVFDDVTLGIVMQHLDTTEDFTTYITYKEKFIENMDICVPGEEELLGVYLSKVDEKGCHCFLTEKEINECSKNSKIGSFICDEGILYDYIASHGYRMKKESNKVSYVWDTLIERFLQNYTTGTGEYISDDDVNDHERIFRFLASEDRTNRRLLGAAFIDFLKKYAPTTRATKLITPTAPEKPAYLFLKYPFDSDNYTYEEYRKYRMGLLQGYMMIAKNKHREIEHVIGIATEAGIGPLSEDLAYMEIKEWSPELREEIRIIESDLRELGLLGSTAISMASTSEYPDSIKPIIVRNVKGTARNKLCPCGSGKKYKKCCWQLT